MRIELSEAKVKDAFEDLSWSSLESHLSEIALTEKEVEKLVGLMRRSDHLVLKRNHVTRQNSRRTILDKLAALLNDAGHSKHAELVRLHAVRLDEIDAVYQSIIGLLSKIRASSLPPKLRVSALISRSNHEYIDLLDKSQKSSSSDGVLDLGKVTLKGEGGGVFSPEAVHELLVSTLASTLGMEAHINGWYDSEGALVLPGLPEPSAQDRITVGDVQLLAAAWRHWQFAERRHRYLDAPLERIGDLPEEWGEHGIKVLWDSRPDDERLELYSHVANARLAERLLQHWAAMLVESKYGDKVSGTDGETRLLPEQWISLQELHSASVLSQLLSGDVTNDESAYAGLTLAEWIRGYSVLQDIAEKSVNLRDADGLTLKFTEAELIQLLLRNGLKEAKAQIFTKHATYRKASRDLFDQPLIKCEGGGYLLLAIAAAASSIPRVILSTLGMLEVNLDQRGKRFEKHMIDLLARHGIQAKNILCDREGATYDYDVAFVWGDYFFFFECKSRNLSAGDPARIYFSSLGVTHAIKQVARLTDALNKHPDILSTHMPEAVGKKVVRCVVNSLPYSRFTEEGEIHFADESGIARFFSSSEVAPRRLTKENGADAGGTPSTLVRLWGGEKPTPEDFLRHLMRPIQLVNFFARLTQSKIQIQVGEEDALQIQDFLVNDWNADEHRRFARRAGYSVDDDRAAG